MEFMKKFRIGSGLQKFHIRTPLVFCDRMVNSVDPILTYVCGQGVVLLWSHHTLYYCGW